MTEWDDDYKIKAMKVTIGRTSERFAANLEQLKKESTDQIRRSFDSIVTLKDFLSEADAIQQTERYTKLVSKLDSVEKRLSRFEDSLSDRVSKLIREYDKLKSEVDGVAQERKIYKTLFELSTLISSQNDIEDILPNVVQSTAELLNCDHAVLQMVDEDGEILLQVNSEGADGKPSNYAPSRKISDAVMSTGDPVLIESTNNDDCGCTLCFPLKSGENVCGLLHVVRSKKAFSPSEMELLKTLSGRIGLSVESNLILSDLANSRETLIEDLRDRYDFEEIIGNSPEIARVLATIADVAETESAVLIEGESGTGKELLARALHNNSKRKDQPFVAINCAAIPETLLESELFGYEKGAFTGAVARKLGKFDLANDGTIFLDEIGELTPLLQVKLLRFLQSHEFEPLGSTSVKIANVRIISATKKDLGKMVESGEFRDDLYYRINVIAVRLPSLSERISDIDILANHFLKKYAEKNSKKIKAIDDMALSFLKEYNYPGNIRELENIIERAVVLCKGDILSSADLPDCVKKNSKEIEKPPASAKELQEHTKKIWRETILPLERNFVLRMLEASSGNISAAARQAGMHRKQFQRILRRCGLPANGQNQDS